MLVKKNCKHCKKEFEYNKTGYKVRTYCSKECLLNSLKGLPQEKG